MLLAQQQKFFQVSQVGLSGKILHYAANYKIAYAVFVIFFALMVGFVSFYLTRRKRS
jgi:lipopolysaccharide export LptBFGC system permease protein LptF